MRKKLGVMVVALMVAALLGFGVGQLTLADPPARKKLEPDPSTGLSTEEKEQAISAARQVFQARLSAWLEDFDKKEVDLRSLPRSAKMGNYAPPLADLQAAVVDSDIIVIGTARANQFMPDLASRVTFSVERALKGTPPASVTLTQSGGPYPRENWVDAILGYAENDPLLLPGDRALLFLKFDAAASTFRVLSFTGNNRIGDQGRVTALEGNPFASEISGQTEGQIIAKITALLGP